MISIKAAAPLEIIRAQTRQLHARVEASFDLTVALESISSYRLLLHRYLSVYEPFEEALFPQSARFFGIDSWAYRSKVELLERDLLILQGDAPIADLPLPAALPKMETLNALLGALYVIEGSSLGGQVIYREVQKKLSLDSATGAAFFFGDGAQTFPLWKQFTAVLNRRVSEPEEATAAAREIFEAFERALRSTKEDITGL